MRKYLLSIMLLALLSVADVHGASEQFSYEEKRPKLSEKIKFGARIGVQVSMLRANKAYEKGISNGRRAMVPKSGFSFGYLHAKQEISDDCAMFPKNGFSVDLYGEYALTDTLGVDLTLMYTQKKAILFPIPYFFNPFGSFVFFNIEYGYFALASSLRVYPGQARQFCIFLGPCIGYLVNAEVQLVRFQLGQGFEKTGGSVDKLAESLEEKGKPNQLSFGAVFGIDYELDNGVLLGGTYDVGFSSIIKENKNISQKSDQPKATNAAIRAFIGYNVAKLFT